MRGLEGKGLHQVRGLEGKGLHQVRGLELHLGNNVHTCMCNSHNSCQ